MTADLGLIAAAAYPSPPSYPPPPHRKPSVSSFYDRPAMASLSPNQPSQLGLAGGPSPQEKPALSTLNVDFLRTLTEKRTTRDGQPQKRRGPKPDSKPALTRRQELNRQAQRTHRERKELYIKALEDEVLRLKEIFSNVSQDKQRLAEENRQLRALLEQNGLGAGLLPAGGGSSVLDDSLSNPSVGYSPSTSMAGSYIPGGGGGGGGGASSSNTSAFTPPPPLSAGTSGSRSAGGGGGGGGISPNSATYPHSQHHHHQHQHSGSGGGQRGLGGGTAAVAAASSGIPLNQNPNIDYEQAGIDFVLALEKPCMNHMPWLLERSTDAGGREPCGHALMASCPPEPFSQLSPDIPFGGVSGQHYPHHNHSPVQQQQQQQQQQQSSSLFNPNFGGNATAPPPTIAATSATGLAASSTGAAGTWTLSKGDLATLLDLSRRLNLDGEITPVMAWGMVLAHPRLAELRPDDFARLAEELGGKVRCYGFGAVMEEFEVRDALENVFSMRPDFGMGY